MAPTDLDLSAPPVADLGATHKLVLRELEDQQEATTSDIAAEIGYSQRRVREVLGDLKGYGLVNSRPDPHTPNCWVYWITDDAPTA